MEKNNILLLDEDICCPICLNEAQELKTIQKKFMESYLENRKNMSVDEWLHTEMAVSLPGYSEEEIARMSDEIIATLKIQEEKKESLEKAIVSGRSKESWFASEIQKATSHMSAQEASQYLQGLDEAVTSANESLYRTIHTQAGNVNQNPNLDGFIAEQYHVQTFNLNAEATGSPYRAKVLEPDGTAYAKNSVDIEIIDENGIVVRRYQSKYCKDADATAKAFKQGDYRGQQKLVPEGQEQKFDKKVTTVLEAPDGTTSKSLSKECAKELQNEAQSGKWNELDWNEYKVKDIAIGIGKQAGQAAFMGAAIGVGFDVANKVWNKEEIKGEELVETAIVSGSDFGVKVAAAGALKVGVEKGIIRAIPKGTPADTIATIVHVGIENAKIIGKIATGELSVKEGIEKMEQTTVAVVAGISASTQGAIVGAAVGSVLGPIGTIVGGVVGGTIGYMAGSKVGETVVKGVQKIRDNIINKVENVWSTVKEEGVLAWNKVKVAMSALISW